jgi:hypothetical protein
MKTLFYEAPITSLSGYGEHSREIASYLLKMTEEFNLYFIETQWGTSQHSFKLDNNQLKLALKNKPTGDELIDIYVKVGLPEEFVNVGKFNVGISAVVEASVCSKDSILKCNLMDLIIVPSAFCKSVLETSATKHGLVLSTNIQVIPQCVNYQTKISSQADQSIIDDNLNVVDEEFCFLSVGEWNVSDQSNCDRKNIETLVRTFIKTFQDYENRPGLVLKTHYTNYCEHDYDKVYTKIKNILDSFNNPPNIYLLHGHLTKQQLISLYEHEKIKCHIYCSRGEGFGRSILESTLSGKPTFTSNWSGPLDFIHDESFLIQGNLTQVPHSLGGVDTSAEWYEVSTESLAEKFKNVFETYEEYLNKMKNISTENKIKHTANEVYRQYKEVFNSYILSE